MYDLPHSLDSDAPELQHVYMCTTILFRIAHRA